MKGEEILMCKALEGMLMFVREAWKDAVVKGIVKPANDKYYEFLKDRISERITEITQKNNPLKGL